MRSNILFQWSEALGFDIHGSTKRCTHSEVAMKVGVPDATGVNQIIII